jgi:hypothetical protein
MHEMSQPSTEVHGRMRYDIRAVSPSSSEELDSGCEREAVHGFLIKHSLLHHRNAFPLLAQYLHNRGAGRQKLATSLRLAYRQGMSYQQNEDAALGS